MTTTVEKAIERFQSSFDKEGFLHGATEGLLTCGTCGVKLSGPDGPRPAETYAGTYNGLCYRCTSSGRFIAEIRDDGRISWSFPPHCPSWRRDRETYIAWKDCEVCEGTGTTNRRAYSRGGSGPFEHCPMCAARQQQIWDEERIAIREGLMARATEPAPLRSKRVTFLRALQDERFEERLAWTSGVEGLLVGRSDPEYPRDGWMIFHELSGKHVAGPFKTRKAAIAAVRKFHGIMDWSVPESELDRDTALAVTIELRKETR